MTEMTCKICGGQLAAFIKDIFDDRHGFVGRFDIYRCTICGFGQTIPEIPVDRIGEIYTDYYPRKNIINIDEVKKQRVEIMSPIRRWLLGVNNTAHYHIRKGTKVLDMGCGDCTSVREINAFGAEAYGIEPDQNISELVSTLKLNVHIGLFNEIPYPADYFHFITMSQVLEHIHDPIELLKSFQRILKDDGQVIIGVPNMDSQLRKKYGPRWLNWHVPYHINHFTSKSLRMLAEKSGFKVHKIRTYTPNLWVDLQKKLAAYPVCEGARVPFFNGEPYTANENRSRTMLMMTLYLLSKRILRQSVSFITAMKILRLRLVDSLGMGESYLVFMTKK
jgi:SAM-dependent methyltransferase